MCVFAGRWTKNPVEQNLQAGPFLCPSWYFISCVSPAENYFELGSHENQFIKVHSKLVKVKSKKIASHTDANIHRGCVPVQVITQGTVAIM